MSVHILVTLLSLLFSGLGLAYLNHTDAKRRRTYKLPAYQKPQLRKWVWWLVLVPCPLLILFGQWAALVMWATAISLVGWGLAVRKPTV